MAASASGHGMSVCIVLESNLLVLAKDLDLRSGEAELRVRNGGRESGGHRGKSFTWSRCRAGASDCEGRRRALDKMRPRKEKRVEKIVYRGRSEWRMTRGLRVYLFG